MRLKKPDEVYFTFDEDKIIDATKDFSPKLKWSYFGNYFFEGDENIYLFSRESYSMPGYSATEIGLANFINLKQMAIMKLKLFDAKVRLEK